MKLFQQLVFFVALTGSVSAGMSSTAEIPSPPEFKAEYSLYMKGIRVAKVERRFSRPDTDEYLYHSETRTTGLISLFRDDHIIEVSRGQVNGNSFRPMHYRYNRTGSKRTRRVSVRFDWDKNQVTNLINGSAWEMEVKPGILDKLLYQFIIMHDLKRGKSTLTYAIADGGRVKTYRFKQIGKEIIQTPLGEMHTVKLSRYKSNSKREMILWCAPDLHYLPVKVMDIEEDGNTVAIINSLKGLGYQDE